MAGDDLRRISPERLELIKRVLPMITNAARPLNLFENPFPEGYPSIWSLEAAWPYGPRKILAIFNLTDRFQRYWVEPEWLGIPQDKEYTVLEWWQYRRLGCLSGALKLEVPPEDAAVLHAAPVLDVPRVVSVGHHITGGYILDNVAFDEDSGELSGELVTKPGLRTVLFGHTPTDWELVPAKTFHTSCSSSGEWQYEIITTGTRTGFRLPFRRRGG
jgi:hypothetical protein